MASTAPVFTVKATYRSETRKFSFPQSTFPTYDQLYDQLYRVFPISHSFCLSRILFSPNADNPSSRILIGSEAHNAAEYDAHIAPYKNREWPGALLRLSVSDETPHKVPNGREKDEVPEKVKSASSRGRHRHTAPAPPTTQHPSQKDEDKEKQQETTAAAASFTGQGIHIGFPQMNQSQSGSPSGGARISLQLGDKSWQLGPLSNGENTPKVFEGADNGVAWKVITDPHHYKVEVNSDQPNATSPNNTGVNNPSTTDPGDAAPTSGLQGSYADPYADAWRKLKVNSLADSAQQQQTNAPSGNAPPAPPRPNDSYAHIRRSLSSYLSHTSPMPRDLPHPPHPSHPHHHHHHHFPYPPPSPPMGPGHFFPMAPPPPPPHMHPAHFFPYGPPPPPPPPPPFPAPPPMVYVQPPTPAFDRRPSAAAPKSRSCPRFLSPEAASRPVEKPTEKRPRTEEARVQRLQLARAMAAGARKKIDPIHERSQESEVEDSAKDIPCCNVQQGKEEVQALVDRFATDLERVLKNTFGEGVRGIEVAQLFATEQDKGKGKEVVKEEVEKAPKDETIKIELQKSDEGKYNFNPEELIHLGIICDMCDKTIVGTRHKCTECADYDLCDPCLLTLQHLIAFQYGTFEPGFERSNDSLPHPASHKFAVIEHPQARRWKLADDGFWRVRSPGPNDRQEPVSVSGATASGEQTVFGGFGEAISAQQREMEAFRAARDAAVETFTDAPSVKDTAMPRSDAFNAARDAVVQSFANPPTAPLASGFAEAVAEHTAPEVAPVQENPRVRHLATCDLCDSNIRGARYKCLDCPDFDTCSSCFAIVNEQHPRHSFARISRAADLIRGSGWRAAQSAQAVHPARCDSCGKAVVGVRYKCMHPGCPDFDLCASCEALPIAVHPDTHPLLKIKTPGSVIPTVYRYGDTTSSVDATKSEPKTPEQPQEEPRDAPQEAIEKPMPMLEMPNPFATPPGASQPLPDVNAGDSTLLSPGRTATPDYVEDMVRRLEARERADRDSLMRRESWRSVWESPAPEQEPLIRLDEQAQLPRVQPTDFNELFDLASQFRHLLDGPPPEVRERERGGVRRAYRSVVVADDVGVPSAAEVVEQQPQQPTVDSEEEKRKVRAAYRQLGESERVAVPSDLLDAEIVTAVRVPTPAAAKNEAERKEEEPTDEEKKSIRAAYRQLDAETGSEPGATVAMLFGPGEPEVVSAKSRFDDRGEERRRRSRAAFRRSMQPGPVDESLVKKLSSDNAVLDGDVTGMCLRPKIEEPTLEERRAVRAGYRQLATGSNASVGVPSDFGDLGVIVSATTDVPPRAEETQSRNRTEEVLKALKRRYQDSEPPAESEEGSVPDELTLEEKKAIRKAYRELDLGSEPRQAIAVPDDLDDIAIVTATRELTPTPEDVEDAPFEQTAEEEKNTRAAFRNLMQSGPVDKTLLRKLASPGAVLDPELGALSGAGLLPRTWGDIKEEQEEDDKIEVVPSEQSSEQRRSIRGAFRRMTSETACQTRPAVAVPDDLDNVVVLRTPRPLPRTAKTSDDVKPAPAKPTPEEKQKIRTRYRNLMQRASPAYEPLEAVAAQHTEVDPAFEIPRLLKGRFLVKKPAAVVREEASAEEASLEEKRAIRKAYREMWSGDEKGKEAVAAPSDLLDTAILVSSARPQSTATSEVQTDAEVPTPTPQEIRAAYRTLAQPSSDGQSTATVSVPTEATFSEDESPLALLSTPERSVRPPTDHFGVALTELLSGSAPSTRPTSLITDDSDTVIATADAPLRAAFVADNNIPDGQMFPPGAEFVKSWRMRNDGTSTWPKNTELVFVAGDRMLFDMNERFGVGSVKPGEEVDVWTGEMKAPDIPGKYIGYWRLSDGQGNRFGHSIWIDITVAEPSVDAKDDSEGSLASSSVIMPRSAPERSSTMTTDSTHVAGQDEATTAPLSPDGSFSDSSVSLIDVPSDDEEDVFVDSRSHIETSPSHHSPEIDYVVLDDSSDEE